MAATRTRKRKDEMPVDEAIVAKGLYRVNITEDGKVVGDSGWVRNTIVNTGFQDFLCALLGNTTGSKQVSRMTLGSGTAPAVTDTTGLNSEVIASTSRRATVGVSINASKTVSFLATFQSTNSFVTASYNISNIGLLDGSGNLFAGNTFGASSLATNQNVNATYQISFS